MPFNIAGEWIPSKKESESIKPVKVRLMKRGKNVLTVVLNLNLDAKDMSDLASQIKRKLGCGGSVKGNVLEFQGDKVELVRKFLTEKSIKCHS